MAELFHQGRGLPRLRSPGIKKNHQGYFARIAETETVPTDLFQRGAKLLIVKNVLWVERVGRDSLAAPTHVVASYFSWNDV